MTSVMLLGELPDVFWLVIVFIAVQFAIIGRLIYDNAKRKATKKGDEEMGARSKSTVWGNAFFVLSIALSLYLMYSFAGGTDLGSQKTFAEVFSDVNVPYLVLSLCALVLTR